MSSRIAVHVPAYAVGMVSSLHFCLHFTQWAEQQHELTELSIRNRYEVSKATAYRWLAAWKAFKEQQPA